MGKPISKLLETGSVGGREPNYFIGVALVMVGMGVSLHKVWAECVSLWLCFGKTRCDDDLPNNG